MKFCNVSSVVFGLPKNEFDIVKFWDKLSVCGIRNKIKIFNKKLERIKMIFDIINAHINLTKNIKKSY
jgi:hypothetical protein